MALIHDNRIPPFPATTLSTNHFRWLQEGDWGDSERESFHADRRSLALGIFDSPPVFRDSTKPHLKRVGRWVLNPFPQNSEEIVGWAEAQLMHGTFRTGFLFLGRPEKNAFPLVEAWSFLISAAFIQWNLDTLRVVPAHMPVSVLSPLGGESKTIWTPHSSRHISTGATTNPLATLSILHWDQNAWWEGEHGSKNRLALAYLSRRRSKYEEEQRCRCSSKF